MKLSEKQVEAWVEVLVQGETIGFGYCPRELELTPAIIDSGSEGVFSHCGMCGLSGQVESDQLYPGYSIGRDMPVRRAEALTARGLDTAEGQKKWLREKLQEQYATAEREMDRLIDQTQSLASEKQNLTMLIGRVDTSIRAAE